MEAKIVKIVDEYKVAINIGSKDGVEKNNIFMIFQKGDELFDPDTKESLGILEIPKLKMKVFNIQDKLTLLESAETKIITDRKIKKTIKKSSNSNQYSALSRALNPYNDDAIETIIEEEPKEEIITIKERNVEENNIARKIN